MGKRRAATRSRLQLKYQGGNERIKDAHCQVGQRAVIEQEVRPLVRFCEDNSRFLEWLKEGVDLDAQGQGQPL